MVDLHGQHEHQALLDPETHLDLLDRYAGLDVARQGVASAFQQLQSARAELSRVRELSRQRASRMELIEFQLAELDRVQPRPGEDDELRALRTLLSSAERVRRLADESYELLYDRDDAVLAGLGQVWKRVGELAALDGRFAPFLDSRDSIKSQLEDLSAFLRGYAASIDASPERLQEVEDRLAALERLIRKHGPTLADVIEKRRALRAEQSTLESLGDRLASAEADVNAATAAYLVKARELSALRQSAAARFARALVGQLKELAMEHTRFEVRFEPNPLAEAQWTARGIDAGEFYVSPNPGEDLRPLARVVSGGEMSRIMLAIKSLASLDQPGKTLIFDEVDAGIGGTGRGRGRREAPRAGGDVPGAVHHPPSTDRGLREPPVPDPETGACGSDQHRGRLPGSRRSRGRAGQDDWRRGYHRRRARERPGDAEPAAGRKRNKTQRRKSAGSNDEALRISSIPHHGSATQEPWPAST